MNAEIIAIGDELTSGQRLDTNSQWLSQQLGELGIKVLFHTTVADDLEADAAAFRIAAERADIVISTGGLGPTADDLTRQAIAQATEKDLVQNEAALEHIRALFSQRKRAMPERNVVQAMFPESSRMIPNPHGTAPGIDIDVTREGRTPSRIFALPGVPAEMREMWSATVAAELAKSTGASRKVIRHRRIKCFGVGESDLEQMLPDLIRRGRHPSVGITVSQATITLRVTAEGESEAACEAAIAPTVDTIRQCLGVLVYGEEDDDLQHAVLQMLGKAGQTLSVAEWGSGGLVSSWLSEADPARDVFHGGYVVGGRESLLAIGGASPEVLQQHGAASAEVVREMAERCRCRMDTDYALAIGPFPQNPVAGEPDDIHFGLASAGGVVVKSSRYAGHPDILRSRAAKQALNVLRLSLHRR